jgi:hypothetical protein
MGPCFGQAAISSSRSTDIKRGGALALGSVPKLMSTTHIPSTLAPDTSAMIHWDPVLPEAHSDTACLLERSSRVERVFGLQTEARICYQQVISQFWHTMRIENSNSLGYQRQG